MEKPSNMDRNPLKPNRGEPLCLSVCAVRGRVPGRLPESGPAWAGAGRWAAGMILLAWLSGEYLPAFGAEVTSPSGQPTQASPKPTAGVAALIGELRSDSLPTRVAAADALGRMGTAGLPAVGPMLDAMSSPEAWVAVAMMDGIKAMGPAAHPVVLDLFARGTGDRRSRAGMVLWLIGAEAQALVPEIQKLREDTDPRIRDLADMILKKIEEEQDAPPGTGASASRVRPPGFPPVEPRPPRAGAGATDWPGFRGPNRDGICAETGLLKEWPEGGPKLLWKLERLGRGFSTVSIAAGRLFTMGDRQGANVEAGQFVLAYDLESRKELWATRVGPPHPDGGPRCTPTVDGPRLYALHTDGDLVCLETATGAVRWRKNLAADFGGRIMTMWKYCESPLVDGSQLICTPGGEEAGLVALDKETGALRWKSPLPALGPRGKDGAGYASPVVAEIAGVRQYVQVVGRGVVGVAADTGRFLWGYNRVANDTANISNPVIRGNHVFVANSYNAGSALLQIKRDGERFSAEEVYFVEAKRFDNHHGGIVLVGDCVYGGVGLNKGDPVCLDFATGETRWRAKAPSSGSASVVYADGHIVFRYDRGLVVLVEADPKGYRSRGQFTALTGEGPAWAYPVIHRRRLYLRHGDLLGCYDLSANP